MVRSTAFLPLVGGGDQAHHRDMFRAHCDHEGREVLLTTRRIRSIELTDGATVIAFTCWCGHDGVLVDRSVTRPHAEPVPVPHQFARPAA